MHTLRVHAFLSCDFYAVFAIHPISGDIQTLLELDREETGFYSITVSAEDSGVPSHSTTVAVLVTVGDVNDNDPFFSGGAVLNNTPVEVYEVKSHKPCTV